MKRRIRNGLGDDDRKKCNWRFRTHHRRDERRRNEEKGLILPRRMEAKVRGGIHMPLVIAGGTLVRFEMGGGIQGKQMMLMIELMGKYLAIERPAKGVGHHADEQ